MDKKVQIMKRNLNLIISVLLLITLFGIVFDGVQGSEASRGAKIVVKSVDVTKYKMRGTGSVSMEVRCRKNGDI